MNKKILYLKSKTPKLYKYLAATYRFINPLFSNINVFNTIKLYVLYINDWIKFKKLWGKVEIPNNYPILNEKTINTLIDSHYYYQQLWCFHEIFNNKPSEHYDFWSTYSMSWYIAAITKSYFLDFRPIQTQINNLKCLSWNLTNLELKDNSIESASCLHVIEHIWLWRYWDPVDPYWDKKACNELKRIIKPWWILYISVPIGKENVMFNAHRVYNVDTIINYFEWLKLLKLNYINDNHEIQENSEIKDVTGLINKWNLIYWLGFFIFCKE